MVWPIIEKCSGASVDITMHYRACQRSVARFLVKLIRSKAAKRGPRSSRLLRPHVRAASFQSDSHGVNLRQCRAGNLEPPKRIESHFITYLNHAETCHMELRDGAPQEARKAPYA